ncbi:MAG: spore germination protein [bacterium]|nr:spore germination protein [bacterium]
MDDIVEKIRKETLDSPDIVIRDILVNDNKIYLIFSEVLCDGEYINDFILKRITMFNTSINLFDDIYNNVPANSIKEVSKFNEIIEYIFQGFCLVLVDNRYLMIESKANLDRGIVESNNETSITGTNEAFCENFNKNLGLIRKRIRSSNLCFKKIMLGRLSKTRVGLCFMKNIADDSLISSVYKKLEKIDIDGIIDTGYIKEILFDKESIFPTVIITERPDTTTQALLEGKVAIIVDNSPYSLIIPTFFIDFFHVPDDYYQKPFNITFTRIIRLISFVISVFAPAYYISVTTHNPESIPKTLLTNFSSQRLGVPFPGFIEALIMIICFEILRESDARTPSKMGTSVSILGGLILGEAAVSAGIVSPIMIIVIAISMISGMLFTSNSLTYSIRYFRIILLILSAFFGLFGMFIGIMFLIIKLCSINSFGYPYMAPFSPLVKTELRDSIIKTRSKNKRLRNPLLASKNMIRGKNYEKD